MVVGSDCRRRIVRGNDQGPAADAVRAFSFLLAVMDEWRDVFCRVVGVGGGG
mgnify:CR=1 FL=1